MAPCLVGGSPGRTLSSTITGKSQSLWRTVMADTTCHMSISLDGFVAGPDQSREDPLGKRGRELHGWHLGDERANEADATAERRLLRPRGAYVMGRNMFGSIRGDWDEEWSGRRGPSRPTTRPCSSLPITLTRRSRWRAGRRFTSSPMASTPPTPRPARLPAQTASTSRAAPRPSAKPCWRASSTSSARHRPRFLGSGEGIFNGVAEFDFEPDEVLHSPLATHICYRRAG